MGNQPAGQSVEPVGMRNYEKEFVQYALMFKLPDILMIKVFMGGLESHSRESRVALISILGTCKTLHRVFKSVSKWVDYVAIETSLVNYWTSNKKLGIIVILKGITFISNKIKHSRYIQE